MMINKSVYKFSKVKSMLIVQIGLVILILTGMLQVVPANAQSVSTITPAITTNPISTATPSPENLKKETREISWLALPEKSSELASDRSLFLLAGELIFRGLVDASSCEDNGLLKNGNASPCGERMAHNAVILWQNQFDEAIFQSAVQKGVPPYLLKTMLIQESQFWPAQHLTNYGYYEYGMGHVTQMGADTLLRWNTNFYKSTCRQAYNAETCQTTYSLLSTDQQAALRGVVMNLLSSDCSGCMGGISLERSRASLPVIAAALRANYNHTEWLLKSVSTQTPKRVFEGADVWRMTIASYNAGPGCVTTAVHRAKKLRLDITWKNVSSQFDTGCAGAIEYVNRVTSFHPASPEALLIASTDTSLASRMVMAGLGIATTQTPSPTLTLGPITASPSPTETIIATAATPANETTTPAATIIITAITPSETPTPTLVPPTETPTPVVITSTPPDPSNEIMVKFNVLIPDLISDAIVHSLGGEITGSVDGLEITLVKVPVGEKDRVIKSLESNLLVDYVEPNYSFSPFFFPNDPGYSGQTALADMQIPEAWDISQGKSVVVAVIDTGVDPTHPDLSSNIWINTGETGLDASGNDMRSNRIDDDNDGYVDDWQGWNFVDGASDVNDKNGHGTHGAGIIAARMDNNEGIAGIAPLAQIMPLKALNDKGFGTYANVAEAIVYAVDHGAKVINLGFGGSANSDALLAATDYAYDHGVTLVAASGNSGSNTPYYPAANPHVIAVSSLDATLELSSFSSYGSSISLSASGEFIPSTFPNGQYQQMSGTSMSSAEVSGVVALLAVQPQNDTADKIRDALVNTALDLGNAGRDDNYGFGLVQAFDALQYIPGSLSTPTNSPVITQTLTAPPGGDGGVSIMAITPLNAWTNVYHGTSTALQNIAYTVPTGSNTNRLLVVGISSSRTTAGARAVTLTYGNQTLTSVAGDMATTTVQQHTQLYYLNEAGLDAATSTTLSVTVSGGTTRITDVFAAVFDGADQTAPITDSKTYSNGTTAGAGPFVFTPALTVNTNDQAVEIISSMRLANTGSRTITYAANWTMAAQQTWTTTDGVRNAMANRSIPVSNMSDTSSTTFSGSALASMTAMSIKAAPSVPTLTSPTATTITDTTATLGANITSNGGSAITARGTCWGTSAFPTTNCLADGLIATGIFTQARTGLPAGTLIYYRGYATNSIGTGYSPDGSFYTEPAAQASGVTFTTVDATSMTVNWTRGSGTGVIVLMKAVSAVNSDPVDGTYTGYTANTAFGSGTQIGTGNYVVYKGVGTNVTVTGLSALTTYYVAVYEYAGAVDTAGVNQGTNYKLTTPATGSQTTTSLIPPPTVTILLPANGVSFKQGVTITFMGSATIPTNGDISHLLVWKDGLTTIGTGSSFGINTLGVGAHTITASATDAIGQTGTASITITITAADVDPHGSYITQTDKCAFCHRPHNSGSGRLINFNSSPLVSNNFCLSCHSSGEIVVSTHSNIDGPTAAGWGVEQKFELLCLQCHEPHSMGNNLYSIRPPDQTGTLDDYYSGVQVRTSPLVKTNVTFSVTTGANSYDDNTGTGICVTCHVNTANAGYPMVSHTGGAGHSGTVPNYSSQDCTRCHSHSVDNVSSTRDGFMTGCRSCHNRIQDRGAGTARRQIVGDATVGNTGGDFTRASHHVSGSDAVTDGDCQTCHEMTQHKLGKVRLYDQNDVTRTTVYILDCVYSGGCAVNTLDDPADYENFCLSCHDSSKTNVDTTPFSDNKKIPTLGNTFWSATFHNIVKGSFTASCMDCHSNGHGSNKKKLESKFTTTTPWDWAYAGPGTGTDLLRQEENFCYKCHQTGSTTGTPVQAPFLTSAAYPANSATSFFKHDVNATYNIHTSTEAFSSSFGSTNRHIDCNDCHASHAAKRALDTFPLKADSIAVTGVDPVYSGAGTPVKFNFLSQAAAENQICYKCHSSYTTLPTYRPDGCSTINVPCTVQANGLAKLDVSLAANQMPDWRDLAREFNPNNSSFHPISAVGKNTAWPANTWVATSSCGGVTPCSAASRVYCTDCHTNATPATGNAGPHGSPLLHLLKGTANYITDDNGANITHNSGELCFLCHAYATYVGGTNDRFNRHSTHSSFSCYDCHDTHGSENDHMINFNADHITFYGGRNSQTAYVPGNNSGTCWVLCHGQTHNSLSYP
ncbi:MAG: S8 family serine peptidase [Chloroflexi bacterium]|nr:S8 family serine peptidase [Chloroflexota bacterium]